MTTKSKNTTAKKREQTRPPAPKTKPLPAPDLRPIFMADELAKISPAQVAQIAAPFMQDNGEPTEAIRKAYSLLEVAEYCKTHLRTNGSFEMGIAQYQKGQASRSTFVEGMAQMPKSPFVFNEEEGGFPGTVSLLLSLERLIPVPRSTKDKPNERKARFRKFLAQMLREAKPKQNEQKRLIEAGEQIEKFERDGMTQKEFGKFGVLYPGWWKAFQSQDLSERGERGQAAKKAKQKEKS